MQRYFGKFSSTLGEICITADEVGLTGLWLPLQRSPLFVAENPNETIYQAKRWLHEYFSGKEPSFTLPLHLVGTPFQMAVWYMLLMVPYGSTTTYGNIATALQCQSGRRVSAQAVGGAVGRNPVSIVVPCHRVVGANGSLTGYAGGLDYKIALLRLEKVL